MHIPNFHPNLSQLSIIKDKTKYLFVAPSCIGSICMKLVNAKGKIVEKFYIKVGTLFLFHRSLPVCKLHHHGTNFTNSTFQRLDNSLEISIGSREYQLDAQLMMIKEKLNSVVGSDKFSLKINEKEEEIIQRIIS
jgi:hypothetical protein